MVSKRFISAYCFICLFSLVIKLADARDFIFMIDNSGSMRKRSHDINRRIPNSIIEFTKLINKEFPGEDRIAIIKFDNEAKTLMPLLNTEQIVSQKILRKAFLKMDYRGEWTIFEKAFDEAFNIMDTESSETNFILISDGSPDQCPDASKNELLTAQDAYNTEMIIKNKIYNSENINIVLFPFSKRSNLKYFNRFNNATKNKRSLMNKIVKGEELFKRLKSRFVFICSDFPKGIVHFNTAILIKDDDGIFSDVFEIVKNSLPGQHDLIKLRKIIVNRQIEDGLEWAWNETSDLKKQAELMRNNQVNAICMVFANHEQSFKFRFVGCNYLPEKNEGYCRTRNTVGIDEELARQFYTQYLKIEKEIIEKVVPYDEESLTFKILQKNRNDYSLEDFKCTAVILDPDNPGEEYKDYRLSGESSTNEKGIATINGIPRGAPIKFLLKPRFSIFDNKPLITKIIDGGWNEPDDEYPVTIENTSENFPKFQIFAYVRPDEKSKKIVHVSYGNVAAKVWYKPTESGNWNELVTIKDEIIEVNEKKLLRGSTYEIKATLETFLDINKASEISNTKDELENNKKSKNNTDTYPEDDSPQIIKSFPNITENSQQIDKKHYELDKYYKETKIIVTGGEIRIRIPFYLKIPEIISEKIKNNEYINKEKELFEIINDFFQDSIDTQQGGEYSSFRLSYGFDIIKMLELATTKMNFSINEKITLWGKLLETKFKCKETKRYPNKTYELASSFIFLKLIEKSELSNFSKKSKSIADQYIKDITANTDNYKSIFNKAKEYIDKIY